MSLVSTYVRADNEKWYRDPVMSGDGWFICFDDDDPIELVMINPDIKDKKSPEDLLKEINLIAFVNSKPMYSERLFEEHGWKFTPSRAYWIDIVGPIPFRLITKFDAEFKTKPNKQGVYYDG